MAKADEAKNSPAHKFAKRRLVDVMMFSWVYCFRQNLTAVTIDKAIMNFMDKNGIGEDQYNLDTEKTKYQRMEAEYRELMKADGLI